MAEQEAGEPPIEEKLDEAFTRLVEEGQSRLERDFSAMAATALMGGIEVGFGVLALLVNLIAGWAITWILAVAFPSRRHEAMTSAAHFIDAGIGGRSIALGLLAGASMTLMTRMQHGTDSMPARVAAVVAMGFVLAACDCSTRSLIRS